MQKQKLAPHFFARIPGKKADAINKVDDKADGEEKKVEIIVKEVEKKCECKTETPAMIKLDNIKVDITATGKTDDKAGVVFPVK